MGITLGINIFLGLKKSGKPKANSKIKKCSITRWVRSKKIINIRERNAGGGDEIHSDI